MRFIISDTQTPATLGWLRAIFAQGRLTALGSLGLMMLSPVAVSAQADVDGLEDATPANAVERETPANPLLRRSPFLPAGFDAEARTPARREPPPSQTALAQRFEFRGYYQINGEYRFLIKEKNQPVGRWVTLNDPDAAYLVESFDPVQNHLRLRDGMQTESIALFKLDSNTTPMPVNGQPPLPSPTAGPAAGGTTNVAATAVNTRPIPPGATPTEPGPRRRTPPPAPMAPGPT